MAYTYILRNVCIIVCSITIGNMPIYCTNIVHPKMIYAATHAMHQREQRLQDSHVCLYHNMSREMYIDLLVNTYLDHLINGTPLSSAFLKLRMDDDFDHSNEDLHAFSVVPEYQLLFTNLSFPGNLVFGESTYHYFKHNMCYAGVRRQIVKHYIRDSGVRRKIYQAIEDIVDYVRDYSYGVLLQVCISRDLAPTCTYMAAPFGGRSSIYCMNAYAWLFSTNQNITQSFFDDYIRNQDNIYRLWKQDAQELLACVRLYYSLFAHPHQGIHMYVYHTFPQSLCDALYTRLKDVVCAGI